MGHQKILGCEVYVDDTDPDIVLPIKYGCSRYPVWCRNYKHLTYEQMKILFKPFNFYAFKEDEHANVTIQFVHPQEAINCFKFLRENQNYKANLPTRAEVKFEKGKKGGNNHLLNGSSHLDEIEKSIHFVKQNDHSLVDKAMKNEVSIQKKERGTYKRFWCLDISELNFIVQTMYFYGPEKLKAAYQKIQPGRIAMGKICSLNHSSRRNTFADILVYNFPPETSERDMLEMIHYKTSDILQVQAYNFKLYTVSLVKFCIVHVLNNEIAKNYISLVKTSPSNKGLIMILMEDIEQLIFN